MKTLPERLSELKEEMAPSLQSRMIFLLNPKDTKILEAIIAWTVVPKKNLNLIQVNDNATMEDLWEVSNPDIMSFSIALGCSMVQALPRLEQLKALSIIYPDGSIDEMASSIVNIYIKSQVKDLQRKSKSNEDD